MSGDTQQRSVPLHLTTAELEEVLRSGVAEECAILRSEPSSGRPTAVFLLVDGVAHLLKYRERTGEWAVVGAWASKYDDAVVP